MAQIYLFDANIGQREFSFPLPSGGGIIQTIGVWSLTQTADPTTSNDTTQGISVGSIWFNTTAGMLRWWECRDNTQGAAKWVFSGADYINGGCNPATETTQAGSSTALIAAEGNINRQVLATGVTCGGTGADYVLAVYALPGNFFDGLIGTNRGITITAQGSYSASGNAKRCKIIYNPQAAVVGSSVNLGSGSVIADTGSGSPNGTGWCLEANVFKYGAAGSNTQLGMHVLAQSGATVVALLAPVLLTATESGAITIAITGNPATAAGDIALNFVAINAMN